MGRRGADVLLDTLFPRRCPWCDVVIGQGGNECCSAAVAALRMPDEPLILEQMGNSMENICRMDACYLYKDPVSDAILRLKFEKAQWLAKELGELMAEKFYACGLAEQYDLILPVPVSKNTRRARGYNQSALLAAQLAKQCGLAFAANVLVKYKETQRQMGLDRQERKKNVQGAYKIALREKIAGRRILLVDDVVTTGSTLSECGKTLLQSGAKSCGGLCLAAV